MVGFKFKPLHQTGEFLIYKLP